MLTAHEILQKNNPADDQIDKMNCKELKFINRNWFCLLFTINNLAGFGDLPQCKWVIN